MVGDSFGTDHRILLVNSALDAINAYDGSLDAFLDRIRYMQSQIKVHVVAQDDANLRQHNSNPPQGLRAQDLVYEGVFPILYDLNPHLA